MSALPSRAHGWRISLRLAARTARLTLGRTILVGGLIALPVAGVAAAATVYASMQQTTAERVDVELGAAGTALHIVGPIGSGVRQAPTNANMYEGGWDEGSEEWVTDVAALLPTGTRVIDVRTSVVTAKTAAGIGSMDASVGTPWDESLEGHFVMGEGRLPANDSEAMVSPSALERLGIPIGGTLEITDPSPASFTVVGTMQAAEQPSSANQVFLPGSYSDKLPSVGALYERTSYLPDVSLTWPEILELNDQGVTALSRTVALNPPSGNFPSNDGTTGTLLAGLLILGFALIEVALLAAAAFMVGARQQQRTLAVLASVGADRSTVARVVSLNGLVVGISGSLVGIGGGLGVGWLIMQLTADGSRTQYPGFHIQPLWLGAIALLAILAAWVAAIVPARAASKLDIVAALRGALRPSKPRKRTPIVSVAVFVLGLVLVAVGLVVVGLSASHLHALYIQQNTQQQFDVALDAEVQRYRDLSTLGIALLAIGPVVAQIAAMIIAPAIFRLVARALSGLGVGTRLASRDAARNASRTVPAASVVMSTVFLSAFIICLIAGGQKATNDQYQPQFAANQVGMNLIYYDAEGQQTYKNSDDFADALTANFDTDKVRVLSSSVGSDGLVPMPHPTSGCKPDPNYGGCIGLPQFMFSYSTEPIDQKIWVGSMADLALMLGQPVSDQASAVLGDGGIVSFYPQFVKDGTATIDWFATDGDGDVGPGSGKQERESTLPAYYEPSPAPGAFAYFMTDATAASIGLDHTPTLVLASTTTPPTQAQEDAARAASEALTRGSWNVVVETGPQQYGQWQWLVLAISSVIMVAAASVAIGLARSDGRRDDAVLGAIGASPRLRRSFGFWQAIIICGTGATIGAVLGFAEYSALAGASLLEASISMPFTVPLAPLLATVIGVPLVIAIGSWITARPGRTHVMDRSAIA